ncbi:hypothetical protein SAMN05661096_02646 [Marivirga sericea]|uniref:Uncharacterized protein n=1 Tax=Marivirga sericea TaxID=1028 RepID=A0A1X7KG99_9BACT|nr:hypothetical protein [Marivirga sericea]SMG39605.1 hypothetical protein SAMN05661096_02646 [Marivirga sericea]
MKKNFYTKNYFFGLSITIFIMSVIAFSDNWLTDVGQTSNSDPKMIVHGLIMFAWTIVLIIQTNHIRKLNIAQHKKLGITGFLIAVLMLLSINYLAYLGPDFNQLPFFGKANRIFVPVFALMLLFAYLNRYNKLLHQYFIFVGMLLCMEPILSRFCANLDLSPMVFAFPIWLGLWISIFMYDIILRRKLHPILYLGFIFFLGVYIILS